MRGFWGFLLIAFATDEFNFLFVALSGVIVFATFKIKGKLSRRFLGFLGFVCWFGGVFSGFLANGKRGIMAQFFAL